MSRADDWEFIHTLDVANQKLQSGPLAVAVVAKSTCWRFYSSGVLTSRDKCPSKNLDHTAVIVGKEISKTYYCDYHRHPPNDCHDIQMECESTIRSEGGRGLYPGFCWF